MRFDVVWGEAGASEAATRGSIAVVVDALRASATIVAALVAGARRVLPVSTVEQADAYLDDPAYRVAGERWGVRLPQFHYGNSPVEMQAHRDQLAGRTLVLTTSNGTRCVHAALPGAAAVLVGSTINATAVARAAFSLAEQYGCDVTLVAAGLGERETVEDAFAVNLIGQQLAQLGARSGSRLSPVCPSDSLQVFTRAAARLIDLGYQADVCFCAGVDTVSLVPVYRDGGFVKYGC